MVRVATGRYTAGQVVRRAEPPWLCCWGLRDVDAGAPVEPDTLFPICSVTKSFTATGHALLADKGRLDWDAPVREALPEFRLHDPVATEQATLRDLLTHRTGVPRARLGAYGRPSRRCRHARRAASHWSRRSRRSSSDACRTPRW